VDSPVSFARGDFVRVARHVSAMKPADAEVEDARRERLTVVARGRDAERSDGVQVRRAERDRRRDG